MPISRYRCKKCGKEFQVFQKITDSPLTNCSFCAGKVDLIPAPLFHNTPSFSLAFVDKEEEKPKNIGSSRSSPSKARPEKKSVVQKKEKPRIAAKKAAPKPKAKKEKGKKTNTVKKMKK